MRVRRYVRRGDAIRMAVRGGFCRSGMRWDQNTRVVKRPRPTVIRYRQTMRAARKAEWGRDGGDTCVGGGV